MARPKEVKNQRINLRLTPNQKEAWERHAKDRNLTLSDMIFRAVQQSIKRTKNNTLIEDTKPLNERLLSSYLKDSDVRT